MTKGEIAILEQFVLLPQGFQKSSVTEASESVCTLESVYDFGISFKMLTNHCHTQASTFNCLITFEIKTDVIQALTQHRIGCFCILGVNMCMRHSV